MRTYLSLIALALVGIAPARAQLPALPQYVLISPPPGSVKLSLYLDYGRGSGANSGRHFAGGQVLFDMPSRWYASAGVGALLFSEPGVGTVPAFATVLGHEFPREPSLLVTGAQTGIGYVAFDDAAGGRHHQIDIPLAFSIGANSPIPMLSNGNSIFSNATAKPWLAARAQLRHETGWGVGFGGALGMSIVLRAGWGVRLAYDRLWIDDRAEGAFGVSLLHVRPL